VEDLGLLETSKDTYWMSTAAENETLISDVDSIVSEETIGQVAAKFDLLMKDMQRMASEETSLNVSLKESLIKSPIWNEFSTDTEKNLLRWFLYKIGSVCFTYFDVL
jgi:hypothetical protein